MAPRRSGRVIGAVVQTRTKVVQETVEVIVLEKDTQNQTPKTVAVETIIPIEEKAQTESQGSKENKGKKRRRRRRRSKEGYKRYVFRVLKQVHPEMGISGLAMVILNNLMNDMFERLADEATRLSKYTGGMTLSWREIQGAVRLVVPGELGKHAIAEGSKALNMYVSNTDGGFKRWPLT